jgi:iron complex transport system substrate-binding protein
MRRSLLILALLVCALCAKAAPTRIVSLAPSLTELAYDAGAGARLVGTSAYSDYPAAARKLPQVGDAFHIDIERLVALKPTVVLAWASSDPPDLIAKLRGLGFKVAVFEPRALSDIAANLRRIGRLAGTDARANQAARAFEQRLKDLRQDYANRSPVRVFYEISSDPLYTINGKQIISEGIALCGGRNVFADLPALAATVNVGAVIARNPQAIITAGADAAAHARLEAWRRWPHLAAVQHGALFMVPWDEIVRATPRMLDGIEKICRDLETIRQHR